MKKDRELIKAYLEKYDTLTGSGRTAISCLDLIMNDDDLYQEFEEYARKEDYMNSGSVSTIVAYGGW